MIKFLIKIIFLPNDEPASVLNQASLSARLRQAKCFVGQILVEEPSRSSQPVHKEEPSVHLHDIEAMESAHSVRALVPFPLSSTQGLVLEDFSIVPADFLEKEQPTAMCRARLWIPRDNSCIYVVLFFQAVCNPLGFRDASEGSPHLCANKNVFQKFHQPVFDDVHLCRELEAFGEVEVRQPDFAVVEILLARFAECHQAVRSVPARFPRFDVVDVEDLVTRPPLAMLACMLVAIKDVFSHIPEARLFAVLVFCPTDVWIFQFLNIKLTVFHDNIGNRQNFLDKQKMLL